MNYTSISNALLLVSLGFLICAEVTAKECDFDSVIGGGRGRIAVQNYAPVFASFPALRGHTGNAFPIQPSFGDLPCKLWVDAGDKDPSFVKSTKKEPSQNYFDAFTFDHFVRDHTVSGHGTVRRYRIYSPTTGDDLSLEFEVHAEPYSSYISVKSDLGEGQFLPTRMLPPGTHIEVGTRAVGPGYTELQVRYWTGPAHSPILLGYPDGLILPMHSAVTEVQQGWIPDDLFEGNADLYTTSLDWQRSPALTY